MNRTLIDRVIEQMGYEEKNEQCLQELKDVCNYGANMGVSGFIYYSDTCSFFTENRELIVQLAEEVADGCGYGSIFEMIKSFGCLKDSGISDTEIAKALFTDEETDVTTDIQNAMSWFALEEVARYLTDY